MNNTYRNAVDHLKFSEDLYEKTAQKANRHKPRFRTLRIAAVAAAAIVLLTTTAFALEEELRELLFPVEELGTVEADMSDAEEMSFSVQDNIEGVTLHYLDMGSEGSYVFENGFLYSAETGFFRVTENYQLERVKGSAITAELEKNGRTYTLDFDYVIAEDAVVTPDAAVYTMEDGRVLAMARSEDRHCWPVYLDTAENKIEDALPHLTTDAFPGRIYYIEPYRGGLLVQVSVTSAEEHGEDAYSVLYHIADGSMEPVVLPGPDWVSPSYFVENDTIYYKTGSSALYALLDSGEIRQITDFSTPDDMTKGLLASRGAHGYLQITDFINGETYLIDGTAVRNDQLDETTGYNATRHSYDGKILVTHACIDYEAGMMRLEEIALLDTESKMLKRLECHTEHDIHTYGWLDDDRFAVIYEDGSSRYLCIYEFAE